MPSPAKRYPLSTADGRYIPLDVIRPNSFVRLPFLLATGTAPIQVPMDVELLKVRATADCIMQFFASSTVAVTIVDGTSKDATIFLPANIDIIISPPVDKSWCSFIGQAAGGNIFISFLESWTALALQSQITRR